MMDILETLRKYSQTVPVSVYDLIQELGLKLRFEPLDDGISGWIAKEDDHFAVVINFLHSSNRQRFTAAHELGHYIFHRNHIGDGTGDTRFYRSDNTPFPNARINITLERQANIFAANLLMPKAILKTYLNKGVTNPIELAEKFGVSEAAMKIRLGQYSPEPPVQIAEPHPVS